MKLAARKPCGQPGCTCHEYHTQMFDALARGRQEWNKIIADRKAKESEGGFAE